MRKKKKPSDPTPSIQIVLQQPQPEREQRINPQHPDRPKFGFAPAPFVVIRDFKDMTVYGSTEY